MDITQSDLMLGGVFRVVGKRHGKVTYRWIVAATTAAEAWRAMTTAHPGIEIPRTQVKPIVFRSAGHEQPVIHIVRGLSRS